MKPMNFPNRVNERRKDALNKIQARAKDSTFIASLRFDNDTQKDKYFERIAEEVTALKERIVSREVLDVRSKKRRGDLHKGR